MPGIHTSGTHPSGTHTSGTWYPSSHEALRAERRPIRRAADDEDVDWETALLELAVDGDVDALHRLREEMSPVDYEELGWGD